MKCSACDAKKCDRKYENRHKCVGKEENINCSCVCQISLAADIASTSASIGSGIAVVAGGIFFTVLTGGVGLIGLAGIVAGSTIIGAGSSLVMNPIQKKITGERMTLKDVAQDVALGAVIGNFTVILFILI